MSEENKKPRNFTPRDESNKSNNAPRSPEKADFIDKHWDQVDKTDMGTHILDNAPYKGSITSLKQDRKKNYKASLQTTEYETHFSIIFNAIKWLTFRYPTRRCGNKEIWAEIQKNYFKQQQVLMKKGDEESKVKMIKLMQTMPTLGSVKSRTGEMKKAGIIIAQPGAKKNFDFKVKSIWLKSTPEQVIGVVRSRLTLRGADKEANKQLVHLFFEFQSEAILDKDNHKLQALWDKLGLIVFHIRTTGHWRHFDEIAAIELQIEALVKNHQKHQKELRRLNNEAAKDFAKQSNIVSQSKIENLYNDDLEDPDFKYKKKEDEDF